MRTKPEKLKQNNLSHKFKKTGLQIKIMKETKDLEIGTEKKELAANFFFFFFFFGTKSLLA